jgi:hypothetical protein
MLSATIFLLHDNARLHSAAQTQYLITSFKWEQMGPAPAPPGCDADDDLKDAVQKWLTSQAAAFYEDGTQKLAPRYDKSLNNGCEYVENSLKNVESDNNKLL